MTRVPSRHTALHKAARAALHPNNMGSVILAAAVLLFMTALAFAQTPRVPSGQPVLNQARQALLLTKSDATVLKPTRGIFIGDATACNVGLMFAGDTAAVTFLNVQSGASYPFQIIQLMSTGTSCTSVVALY